MTIPYEHRVSFNTQEIGPIESNTLASLEIAPTTSESILLSLNFLATGNDILAKSSAEILVDTENEAMYMGKIHIPQPENSEEFKKLLNVMKLERLTFTQRTKEDFLSGSKALKILKDNLELFKSNGYKIDPKSFSIGHNVIQLPDRYPGFFCHSYTAKINVCTQELIKGKSERKLVLSYTSDMTTSNEFAVYSEFFKSFK